MATVNVTLDENGSSPQLNFDPNLVEIERGARETIYWKAQGSGFTFAALAFHEANPFSNIIVHADVISADDYNQHSETHDYVVLFKVGHSYYRSQVGRIIGSSGPTIRNK